MKMWFYVKTPATSRTLEDGTTKKVRPYALKMREMKAIYKVDPSVEVSEERKACDKAFALACCYSSGRDLAEEMVASNFLSLGRHNEEFNVEMVQVPVFGPPEGLPFPRFGRTLAEGETKESFLNRVEASTRRIVGKIFEHEYVARRTVLGNMPRFNRVFEELGINHGEYVIPLDVILSLEKKDAANNLTVAAESKKRRGRRVVKAVAKRQKVNVAAEVLVESSSDRSSVAESNSVETLAREEVPSAPMGVVPGD